MKSTKLNFNTKPNGKAGTYQSGKAYGATQITLWPTVSGVLTLCSMSIILTLMEAPPSLGPLGLSQDEHLAGEHRRLIDRGV